MGKKKHKALLAFVDGRDQKLTNGGIMAEALKEQGKQQLPEVRRMLDDLGKTAGKVADVVVKTSALKSNAELERLALLLDAANKVFKEEAASSLNDVIKAYDTLLKLKSTRILNTSPLPVICIDEANVLMSWYKGGAAMEEDLNALLRFLVKVRLPLYCCASSVSVSECLMVLCCFADEQANPSGSCHTCHFRVQLHHLAD